MAYDDLSQVLVVVFANGARYSYSNVPNKVWNKLLKAESKGIAFEELIKKGGYEYQKLIVDHEQPEA